MCDISTPTQYDALNTCYLTVLSRHNDVVGEIHHITWTPFKGGQPFRMNALSPQRPNYATLASLSPHEKRPLVPMCYQHAEAPTRVAARGSYVHFGHRLLQKLRIRLSGGERARWLTLRISWHYPGDTTRRWMRLSPPNGALLSTLQGGREADSQSVYGRNLVHTTEDPWCYADDMRGTSSKSHLGTLRCGYRNRRAVCAVIHPGVIVVYVYTD
jgi:hypothetical protein